MKTVVVLAGCAGAGKDTVGNMLVDLLGSERAVRMAYADPLKEAVHALVGVPREILYGTKDVKESHYTYGKTARHWLQWLGTEVGRQHVHPDLWVHRFADRVLATPHEVIFCSDGRFKNEIVTLREHLVGKAEVYSARVLNPRVPVDLTHQSESEIYQLPNDFFDVVIENDGSLDELRQKVAALAAYLGLRAIPIRAFDPNGFLDSVQP